MHKMKLKIILYFVKTTYLDYGDQIWHGYLSGIFINYEHITDLILYDQIFEGTLPLKVESTQNFIDCLDKKQWKWKCLPVKFH